MTSTTKVTTMLPPSNSLKDRLKEQKLASCQPVYSAGFISTSFFVIALLFLVVGIALLVTDLNVVEKVVDYTTCNDCDAHDVSNFSTCDCVVSFELEKEIKQQVYLQFQLTNFHQNHRRYVTSRDDAQLRGGLDSPSEECAPYDEDQDAGIAPCGAIANSLFNDTFLLEYVESGSSEEVPVKRTDIAWSADQGKKFKNPGGDWEAELSSSRWTKPTSWSKPIYELDTSDANNNGYLNEDLIVWMRTASMPTFRKPHRLVLHSGTFAEGLPAGSYNMTIGYNFPVAVFSGTKSFVLTNASVIGASNAFLGIAYIIIGSCALVLAVVFLVLKFKPPKHFSKQFMTNSTKLDIAGPSSQ